MWAKSKFRIHSALLFSVIFCFLLSNQGFAKVLRVEVKSRQAVLEGKVYGQFGDYELVNGTIYFGFDPANPMNARVVDITLAPRNSAGLVEAWANFVVLKPVDDKRAALRSSKSATVAVSSRPAILTVQQPEAWTPTTLRLSVMSCSCAKG